jgi:hypothetical protein
LQHNGLIGYETLDLRSENSGQAPIYISLIGWRDVFNWNKLDLMPFETFDLENLNKERRKAIAKSIRTISVEELKAMGQELFRYADDPWREAFFKFIAENSGATFHHAVTSDGVNILYCRDQDKGMWFLTGSGMGPLQATGRQIMKEMVAGGR